MTVIKGRAIYNCDSELFLSHLTATRLDTSRAQFTCLTRVNGWHYKGSDFVVTVA